MRKETKMNKKNLFMQTVLLVAMGLVTAWGGGNKDAGNKQLYVGFSAGYSMVQHWELEMKGCQAAADEAGIKFEYQFANGDLQKQVADVENFVEKGINMLIIGPCNSEGIVPTINEIKAKGVPVMTSDIGISGTSVVAHVASDNYAIGVKAADYVNTLINGSGKVAIVGWAAASATKDRENGFIDTVKSKYPGIQIIVHQDVGGERSRSLSMSENILQSNRDLKVIFGANAECALGAYGATQSTNRTEVYVVSVESDNEVMDAIAAGSNLCATIAQNPYDMGYQAMSTAIKHLKGEPVRDIAIDAQLVTKENVATIVARDKAFLGK
jgi:ribose transport system substrate-binding protein